MKIELEALERIQMLRKRLEEEGYSISSIEKKDYNYEFLVRPSKIKIQVYFGKKGVKTVIQGNEKDPAFKSIKNLTSDSPELDLKEQKINEPEKYIGSDECGKGDLFGPLVVAAVMVNTQTRTELKKLGVRDSKELNDSQINGLADEIKKIIPRHFYEVVVINPLKYNQLYSQLKNLNKLLNWAHSKAVAKILEKNDCPIVITDKFSKNGLDASFDINHSHVEFLLETKAEKFIGVAAASILARQSFNEWFIKKEQSGLKLPKGASATVEQKAKELLSQLGESKLHEYAKMHFKTIGKIKR